MNAVRVGLRVAAGLGVALLVVLVVVRLVGGTGLPWPGPSVLAFTPYGIPVAVALAVAACSCGAGPRPSSRPRRWRSCS